MKTFFITGHGRSGTHYMARLFHHLGYEIGEQKDGRDGQSHNYPDLWPPYVLRLEYRYLIQVVRNPVLVVESTRLAKYSIPWQNTRRNESIGAMKETHNSMEMAIRSVVFWNWSIAASGPDLTVRVEDAEDVCPDWLESRGFPVSRRGELPIHSINKRHGYGWRLDAAVEWDSVAPETMSLLREHCMEYGYGDPGVIECEGTRQPTSG